MRKKKRYRLSMRWNLTLLVVAEIGAIEAIGWVLIQILYYFGITLNIPDVIWLLGVGIVLGFAVTTFVSKWVFDPVTKLGKAMRRVAEGDFTVQLDTTHHFREIEEIYTNFNRMTSELSATEILQSDFVTNVSHEFKTPINAIEGYATLLQGCAESAEDQTVYVEKILFNTRRLSKLAGNILLLSRLETQAIPQKQTSFRLDEQIRQCIVALEPEWSEKDIEFDVELESIEYTGNENLLIHVWHNLIGNAIKFDPIGGYVRVKLSKYGDEVFFSVTDNGPGIAQESLGHIFDKFYQSDSSHKQEGNGLGLALVKRIVDVCGGSISVSNIPDEGCRFTVVLR